MSGADHIKKSANLRRLGLYSAAVAEIEDNFELFAGDEVILALLQAFYAAKKGEGLGAKAVSVAQQLATLDPGIPTVNKYLDKQFVEKSHPAAPIVSGCSLDHIKRRTV